MAFSALEKRESILVFFSLTADDLALEGGGGGLSHLTYGYGGPERRLKVLSQKYRQVPSERPRTNGKGYNSLQNGTKFGKDFFH